MAGIESGKSVEPSLADPKRGPVDRDGTYSIAALPWNAPVAFRTVPVYDGPLKNQNQTAFRARNDPEAIAVWLAERASGNTNTASAYRKEVERLVFWLADQGLSLSDASREDYIRFAAFLQGPKPRSRWINPKRVRRDDPSWRPFQSGLSPASARQSLTICKSMLSYLHTNGWLRANTMPEPRILVRTKRIGRSEAIALRQIPQSLFNEAREFANDYVPADRNYSGWTREAIELHRRFVQVRLKVILDLAGVLGARSSDLVSGNMKDIIAINDDGESYWAWLIKEGKGSKDRIIPMPDYVMETLSNLRVWVGLTPYPETSEPPCPIIPRAKELPRLSDYVDPRTLKPIGRSGLYRHITEFFKSFSDHLKNQGWHADATLMESASLHWLRHTAGKAMVKKTGGDLNATRKLLGHSSIQTTADYSETSTTELHRILKRHGRE